MRFAVFILLGTAILGQAMPVVVSQDTNEASSPQLEKREPSISRKGMEWAGGVSLAALLASRFAIRHTAKNSGLAGVMHTVETAGTRL
jgi:hypothetical protein